MVQSASAPAGVEPAEFPGGPRLGEEIELTDAQHRIRAHAHPKAAPEHGPQRGVAVTVRAVAERAVGDGGSSRGQAIEVAGGCLHQVNASKSSATVFSKNAESIPVAPTLPISSLSTNRHIAVRLQSVSSSIAANDV